MSGEMKWRRLHLMCLTHIKIQINTVKMATTFILLFFFFLCLTLHGFQMGKWKKNLDFVVSTWKHFYIFAVSGFVKKHFEQLLTSNIKSLKFNDEPFPSKHYFCFEGLSTWIKFNNAEIRAQLESFLIS